MTIVFDKRETDRAAFVLARYVAGLTQVAAAEALGVDPRTVRRWEAPTDQKGAREVNPTALKMMQAIASREDKRAQRKETK